MEMSEWKRRGEDEGGGKEEKFEGKGLSRDDEKEIKRKRGTASEKDDQRK